MTASSFDLSWPMVQEGVIRRSDEELSEVMRRGISPAVCIVATAILWGFGRWSDESNMQLGSLSVVLGA